MAAHREEHAPGQLVRPRGPGDLVLGHQVVAIGEVAGRGEQGLVVVVRIERGHERGRVAGREQPVEQVLSAPAGRGARRVDEAVDVPATHGEPIGRGGRAVGEEVVAAHQAGAGIEGSLLGDVCRERGSDLGGRLDETSDGDPGDEQAAAIGEGGRARVAVGVVGERVPAGRRRGQGVVRAKEVVGIPRLVGDAGQVRDPTHGKDVVTADEGHVLQVVPGRPDLLEHARERGGDGVRGGHAARVGVPRGIRLPNRGIDVHRDNRRGEALLQVHPEVADSVGQLGRDLRRRGLSVGRSEPARVGEEDRVGAGVQCLRRGRRRHQGQRPGGALRGVLGREATHTEGVGLDRALGVVAAHLHDVVPGDRCDHADRFVLGASVLADRQRGAGRDVDAQDRVVVALVEVERGEVGDRQRLCILPDAQPGVIGQGQCRTRAGWEEARGARRAGRAVQDEVGIGRKIAEVGGQSSPRPHPRDLEPVDVSRGADVAGPQRVDVGPVEAHARLGDRRATALVDRKGGNPVFDREAVRKGRVGPAQVEILVRGVGFLTIDQSVFHHDALGLDRACRRIGHGEVDSLASEDRTRLPVGIQVPDLGWWHLDPADRGAPLPTGKQGPGGRQVVLRDLHKPAGCARGEGDRQGEDWCGQRTRRVVELDLDPGGSLGSDLGLGQVARVIPRRDEDLATRPAEVERTEGVVLVGEGAGGHEPEQDVGEGD